MAKAKLYAIIVLLGAIIGGYIYHQSEIDKLETELFELQEHEKEELRRVRDSAFAEIDTLIIRSDRKFDSILNIPPSVKYIPYEKPVYPDRTLDDALDVHADYKADTRATRENF